MSANDQYIGMDPEAYDHLLRRLRIDLHLHGATDLTAQSVDTTRMAPVPAASCSTISPQDITAPGVWYQVQFGNVEWQIQCLCDVPGIKVPIDGFYVVTAQMDWNVTVGGFTYANALSVNGAQYWSGNKDTVGVGRWSQPFARILRLQKGDVIGLVAQTSNAVGNQSLMNHLVCLQTVFVGNTAANILVGNA